jgi:hypothetical protein
MMEGERYALQGMKILFEKVGFSRRSCAPVRQADRGRGCGVGLLASGLLLLRDKPAGGRVAGSGEDPSPLAGLVNQICG